MHASNFASFQQLVSNPIKYRLFLLAKLPMAFLAGLKVVSIDKTHTTVTLRYKWINQNPFKSIYFAVLAMAAELSTGLLAFGNIYKCKPPVSMLVTQLQASFYKKATGLITFTCNDGAAIEQAIQQAMLTKESVTITCSSTGHNEAGEVVASFTFVWSFKAK